MAKVETERFFGKKGIIIMIRDGNKMVSAIFKDKKNADKFNRNKPADVKKLLQLAKKTKFPKAIDEGPKRYNQKDGVGKSKYVISYHDGKKKHKDGSDFFDIQIFRNKKDLAKFVNALHRGGYKYGFGEGIGEDTDVGHQDDEPNMLKSTALEIMEYGKKLMDKLDKYDDMEEEVDFPNWWQSKLIISKEYLQKAYHYLDSEEKTEESVNENKFNRPPDGFNWNKARADAKKAVAREKERSKQVEKEKKELLDAIKIFRAKIKKQGRITNARDEEHLKKLIDLYKMKYPTRPDLALIGPHQL